MIGIQSWSATSLVKAISTAPERPADRARGRGVRVPREGRLLRQQRAEVGGLPNATNTNGTP